MNCTYTATKWQSTLSTYSIGIVRLPRNCIPLEELTDTHLQAECIYSKLWARQEGVPSLAAGAATRSRAMTDSGPDSPINTGPARSRPARLSAKDDAKLIFGTIFSLRNMAHKLGGPDDRWAETYDGMKLKP